MNSYQFGIAWGIGGFAEGRFILRHKEKYFLEQMQLPNAIYQQVTPKGKIQYVLKTSNIDINDLPGWSARNASERDIPILDDYMDFMRAYIELHSRLDYCTRHERNGRRHKHIRLRIYGNNTLIQSINQLLHKQCVAGLKAIQNTVNETTKYIAYTAIDEIMSIFEWIDGMPRFEPFWIDVDTKLREPDIR